MNICTAAQSRDYTRQPGLFGGILCLFSVEAEIVGISAVQKLSIFGNDNTRYTTLQVGVDRRLCRVYKTSVVDET